MSRNPKQKVVIYSLALLWATSADDSVNAYGTAFSGHAVAYRETREFCHNEDNED